jgi:hypothetical protein
VPSLKNSNNIAVKGTVGNLQVSGTIPGPPLNDKNTSSLTATFTLTK